ncbi:unnamed protein product [Vitrella brassicaformis CCMP3155]|uniref:Uncharacterized protein n=1 Tax=Vitrella brassicaformis (strain CCMP3155) TaxID=1169540 RepID=A0A0G4H845_VITBC|nr:unnamed protein product [Vitrella brassicaformis CCMP3155]|mmetsp:Transcript_4189/g.9553  ORF Transcript_4189/g.9553 Transcript_4189/m.9553 type:complete len:134 (-) Transcript_4189:630-1031(-)|eukprot:CEM39908.1 unnamed protein product [Vitrella brassicaformis CCMP3155]
MSRSSAPFPVLAARLQKDPARRHMSNAQKKKQSQAKSRAVREAEAEKLAAQQWAEIDKIAEASVDLKETRERWREIDQIKTAANMSMKEKGEAFKRLNSGTHLTDEMIQDIIKFFVGCEHLSPFKKQQLKAAP